MALTGTLYRRSVGAYQSTTYLARYPYYAIDGNTSTYSQTNQGVGEWLAVDLGKKQIINSIEIFKNNVTTPLTYKIQCSDVSNFSVVTDLINIANGGRNFNDVFDSRDWSPASGRYVRVLTTDNEFITINEIIINRITYVQQKRAWQINTYAPLFSHASYAVDGNTGTISINSAAGIGNWLAIDIGSVQVISTIVLRKNAITSPSEYRIQTSANRDFTVPVDIYTQAGSGSATDSYTPSDYGVVSARYLRIITTASQRIDMKEFEVNGANP